LGEKNIRSKYDTAVASNTDGDQIVKLDFNVDLNTDLGFRDRLRFSDSSLDQRWTGRAPGAQDGWM